jgi:hypothetical protein
MAAQLMATNGPWRRGCCRAGRGQKPPCPRPIRPGSAPGSGLSSTRGPCRQRRASGRRRCPVRPAHRAAHLHQLLRWGTVPRGIVVCTWAYSGAIAQAQRLRPSGRGAGDGAKAGLAKRCTASTAPASWRPVCCIAQRRAVAASGPALPVGTHDPAVFRQRPRCPRPRCQCLRVVCRCRRTLRRQVQPPASRFSIMRAAVLTRPERVGRARCGGRPRCPGCPAGRPVADRMGEAAQVRKAVALQEVLWRHASAAHCVLRRVAVPMALVPRCSSRQDAPQCSARPGRRLCRKKCSPSVCISDAAVVGQDHHALAMAHLFEQELHHRPANGQQMRGAGSARDCRSSELLLACSTGGAHRWGIRPGRQAALPRGRAARCTAPWSRTP